MAKVYECDVCKTQFKSIEEMDGRTLVLYGMQPTVVNDQPETQSYIDEAIDLCGSCASIMYGAIADLLVYFQGETPNEMD